MLIFSTDFYKCSQCPIMDTHPVGATLVHEERQTDGRTDGRTSSLTPSHPMRAL